MPHTPFLTKFNKRLVGADVFVAAEPHTIPASAPHEFFLAEVPLLDVGAGKDVVIPTFTKVTTVPTPGQFKVDFGTGLIQFNSADASTPVTVDYFGTGSLNLAEHQNEEETVIDLNETRIDFAHKVDGDIKDGFIKPIHISTNIADDFTLPNDLTVNGDLTVLGSSTELQSVVVTVADPIVTFNFGVAGPGNDSGIEVDRGSGNPKPQFKWVEANSAWTMVGLSGTTFQVGDDNTIKLTERSSDIAANATNEGKIWYNGVDRQYKAVADDGAGGFKIVLLG